MRLGAHRILVPVKGDAVSERTFRWACQTAKDSKAELHAVYIIEVPLDLPLEAEITLDVNLGEEILTRIEAIASQEKYKNGQARQTRARETGQAIGFGTTDRKMDMVIMGIPYPRRFGSCSMGPTADYIFHNAECQIILWRDQASVRAFSRD